jgi:hypothetical protein
MGKVSITIRCAKCNAVETQVIHAWAVLKTTCGCNGPYRVLVRTEVPEEPAAAPQSDQTAGS